MASVTRDDGGRKRILFVGDDGARRAVWLGAVSVSHVVAGWLGHAPLVAARHDLHVRDDHFNRAARREAGQWAGQAPNTPAIPAETRGVPGKAAQNPAHFAAIRRPNRPRRRPPIPSWRRWSARGPTCPRRSARG